MDGRDSIRSMKASLVAARLFSTTLALSLALGATRAFAADSEHHHEMAMPGGAPSVTSAIAVLVPAGGSNVSGTVKFTQEGGGVHVQADLRGLTPGRHGFHIHEKGDLSKADLTSAGGHYNPMGQHHADRLSSERHEGDLGNIDADAEGHASVDFVDHELQLNGAHSIVGRAVIVHAKADDLKSQPAGDAGGRIAGGVIGIVSTDAGK
jgi:Cu-Zn family superoxide dismutase